MLRLEHIICFNAICVLFVTSFNIIIPGPLYPPTKGGVWPKTQQETKEDTYYKLNPAIFNFKENGETCGILKTAIERYKNVLRNTHLIANKHSSPLAKEDLHNNENADPNYKGVLEELQINLNSPCEDYPHLDMDEKYSLNISAVSTLTSHSIWGILRGLETFSQLFYMSEGYQNVLIKTTQILDYPKYTHRGLLIDTSRHYISVSNILRTLDAMEMNKMNVLHWHIVDDQSFPYQSAIYPRLSKAAYDPTLIYTEANINQIVNYARDRGIRVLPEFDVPGHTSSWGVAYPKILTKCYKLGNPVGLGPMDPTNNDTYSIISNLFREVQERFPDKYLHVGGDEVETQCWRSNPQILQFMTEHNMAGMGELHSYFMSRVIPLLGERSKPIAWQEVFDEGVSLPNGTIVQVWKNTEASELIRILTAGHKVIYSSSWYLDNLGGGGDWHKYYAADPRAKVSNDGYGDTSKLNLDDILGGEACMWGEAVDDTNIISRVWPRASAVAEVLWSVTPRQHSYYYSGEPSDEVKSRLEEHVCRMNRRGISAQPPNGPGFCIAGN